MSVTANYWAKWYLNEYLPLLNETLEAVLGPPRWHLRMKPNH